MYMKNAVDGELFNKVVQQSEKATMVSKVNLKPSPRGAVNPKKA